MQPEYLDGDLLSLIASKFSSNDRKNIIAKNYWYPLNYATYGPEEITSALQSMLSCQTSMWTKCRHYEDLFAEYIGKGKSVFVNSGSSADLLAIQALVQSPEYNLNPGDRVLVPAITWPTQIWSLLSAGLVPVLFDVSLETFNPDITTVDSDVLNDVKAVFTTHILGLSSDMDVLRDLAEKYDLLLIEDTCESLGTTYDGKRLGTFGIISTFSSFFSHHITTMEGGMIYTEDEHLLSLLKLQRAHGWSRALSEPEIDNYCRSFNIKLDSYSEVDRRYLFLGTGFNLRPTEVNASFGIHQLKKLADFQEKRKKLSSSFYQKISQARHVKSPKIHPKVDPCFMSLPMSVSADHYNSKRSIAFLEEHGIESRPLIAGNILKHPVSNMVELKTASDQLLGSDKHHSHSFYIGLSPQHTQDDIDRAADIILKMDGQI